jgi:tRNA uridine 5-carbamoylmethylation protein Kti12
MIIHIWGNLCSGKTTTAKKLLKALDKQFPKKISYFAIDEYRKKYSDGKKIGEENAWMKLEDDVLDCGDNHIVIMESSGTSWRLKYFDVDLIIALQTPLSVCKQRTSFRKNEYKKIPWPYESNLEDSIIAIENKLNDKIVRAELNGKDIIYLNSSDDLYPQLETIIKKIKSFI